jgi:hypothetical protein
MRNRWLRASFMAASITIATAEIWGQELSAEVPFPFQANGADMAPGHYAINRVSMSGSPVVRLTNLDTRKSGLTTGQTSYAQAGKPSPRLIFHCVDRDERGELISVPCRHLIAPVDYQHLRRDFARCQPQAELLLDSAGFSGWSVEGGAGSAPGGSGANASLKSNLPSNPV